MQLIIKHHLKEELILPLSYHPLLQGIIYNCLSNISEYSSFLHDEGFQNDKRIFKLFTFSEIKGNYTIKEGKICFKNTIQWEIRSLEPSMLYFIENSIRNNGIHYGNQYIKEAELFYDDKTVEDEEIVIEMITPITTYITQENQTLYFDPSQIGFYETLKNNFKRKYQACFNKEIEDGIEIYPVHITDKDKVVTKFKKTYITAWKGTYKLKGKRKYLDFLFQVGLGSKNSQGFGMFKVKEGESL